MVTSRPLRATSSASRTQVANAAGSSITWSAANDPTSASGSSRSSRAAASPIAAIESRGDGSAITRSTSGSWPRTASWCAAPVTTTTRWPTIGVSRSTVAWISVRPLPVRSSRNFGRAARESGHSRVPAPPAGTTAHRSPGLEGVMARILPSRADSPRTTVARMRTARTFPELLDRGCAPTRPSRSSRRTTTSPASGPSCRSRPTSTGSARRPTCSPTSSASTRATPSCSTCPRTGWCRCSSGPPGPPGWP